MRSLAALLALTLTACATAPDSVMTVHRDINKVPYVADRQFVMGLGDYYGLAHFKANGGDCENFAAAKCEKLTELGHDCQIMLGHTPQGWHAIALADGKYWLDNRGAWANSTMQPADFKTVGYWNGKEWTRQ